MKSVPPNLPVLAGLAGFEAASVPGLTVDEVVRRLKRFHYSLQQTWQISLARLTSEPLYELKMGLSHHAYLASENVSSLRDRVAEMRHPPLGLDKVPDPALEKFFAEILAAPTSLEWLAGLYGKAFPALLAGVDQHLKNTSPLADAPSVRILHALRADLETITVWGEAALAAVRAEADADALATLADWEAELDAWLAAAGGLDGCATPSETTPEARFSATVFDYAPLRSPQRDERFPDPYNMGVHAEEFLYDEKFADRDKVLIMYYKRIREIDVPEMMATILYEMAISGEKRPWGFYRDLTRQLWDEARHAMMGEVGYRSLGLDWAKLVAVNFTWSKGLAEQLTPQERHAVLWYIEQGLMTKTGKRYEWEVGGASGDPLAELFQDYDWADEVLHARIGRDWYVKDFETVKDAAEYGSACWDKVVSDWEQWKKDGLTEHFNWWPGLYEEACRLRGEEPDPETLAYATSYAETRADLQRISASG